MRIPIILLGLSWLIFAVVWVLGARGAKASRRPLPRGRQWAFVVLVAIGGGLVLFRLAGWQGAGGSARPGSTLWPVTPAVAAAAVILSYAGLAVAVWARMTLGRNGSDEERLVDRHRWRHRDVLRLREQGPARVP